MKQVVKKYTEMSLILRIVIGLVLGAVLGMLIPGATSIGILGTLFVGALKAIAPLLVFALVMSSLANASGNIASRFRLVIALYIISTLLAAILAVVASFIWPVGMKLADAGASSIDAAPGGIGEVLSTLLTNIVANPVSALMNANYIGILFWAIVFGLVMKKIANDATKKFVDDVAKVLSMVVRGVIQCAPFGIFGLVFTTVSENGLSVFQDYIKLLVLLVGCMLAMAFVINPFIAFLMLKRNPYPLVFKCLKQSGVTAFFTRSSAANIPVNMALCEELGLEEDFYSVSIPLGATINMDGAAITITIMTLAAAVTMGIQVSIPAAIVLSLLATISACGASGVAGGSLLLIPMACSLFGINNDIAMQVVAVGFIISVIQDSVETALNSSSDALFTSIADFHDRFKRGEKVEFFENLNPNKHSLTSKQ